MVIEQTKEGMHLHENPLGLLTNSPDFSWQMTNLRRYLNLSPHQQEETHWGTIPLTPYGQGAGGIGLPGDYTPPGRFVKTAFQKTHLSPPSSRSEAVNACFHLLEGVAIPRGVVMTQRGTDDFTQYTMCIDLSTKEYYFKTYDNPQIIRARFLHQQKSETTPVSLGKLKRAASFPTIS